jgi:hypothetical protein
MSSWRTHFSCVVVDAESGVSWCTHFSCVVVDAESGVFKMLMREENLLVLGKEKPGLTKAED